MRYELRVAPSRTDRRTHAKRADCPPRLGGFRPLAARILKRRHRLSAPERPEYALGYGTIAGGTPGAEILYDAIVAVGVLLLRLLTDGHVAPIEVHFSRRPPAGVNYARLLKVSVRFEQHRSCLILDDGAMRNPLAGADPGKHNALLQGIRSNRLLGSSSMSDRVRHEVRRALLDGPPRMPAVAGALGYEVRTLRRRLRDEGTTFSLLSDDVRLSVARTLLDLTNLPIADIAAATGFASASVFAETFRRMTGTTATQVRMTGSDKGLRQSV